MPRARARQTKINDHFSQPPARATRSTAARPTTRALQARLYSQVHRFHSDSEGEDGIANIPLDPPTGLGPPQVRIVGGTLIDSDDEEDEAEYVSPAKRRRKKEELKRPNPSPDAKASMSIPAYRKRDDRRDDDDEDAEDEDVVERRITRPTSSSSEGEVIDVADTDEERTAINKPVDSDSDIVILDAPSGSFAEPRPSRIMNSLASGTQPSSQTSDTRRSRGMPVVELPARGSHSRRQGAARPASQLAIEVDPSHDRTSAPTQPTSRSTSSQNRRQAVVELRSWSQDELRSYTVYNSPNPNATPSDLDPQKAAAGSARVAGMAGSKGTDYHDIQDIEPAQNVRSRTSPDPAPKTLQTKETRKTSSASNQAASPIEVDDNEDDDIPLALPVPGSVRRQRTSVQARIATVDSASDSSNPVRKPSRKVGAKRPVVVKRAKVVSPPIMPIMSDSEEDATSSSGPQKRNRPTKPKAASSRPASSSATRKRTRIESDMSDSDQGGSSDRPPTNTSRSAKLTGRPNSKATTANSGQAAKWSTDTQVGPSKTARSRKGKTRNSYETAPNYSDEDDLGMDEMKRFKTESRLRKQKETPFQRNLRKMKAKQRGIVETTTEEEDNEEDKDEDDDASDSRDSADFYVTDDDDDEAARAKMPAQFRIESAQTPEYKFKVVLHYFVYLVVNGPKALPLRGKNADYFNPMLRDVRRLLEGYRNSRVRSQIWRPEFVRVLEKYPEYNLPVGHAGCDACHMSGRYSRYQIRLEGDPYHPETHEPYEVDSEEEREKEEAKKAKAKRRARRIRAGSEPSSSEDEEEPRLFHMGQYCNARARTYHSMSHWEDTLYYRVRSQIKLLRRAHRKSVPSDSEASSSEDDSDEAEVERETRRARRDLRRDATRRTIAELRRKGEIPRYNDVDAITEWMDERGEQAKELRWFNDLITSSEDLEYNKNKTDD